MSSLGGGKKQSPLGCLLKTGLEKKQGGTSSSRIERDASASLLVEKVRKNVEKRRKKKRERREGACAERENEKVGWVFGKSRTFRVVEVVGSPL